MKKIIAIMLCIILLVGLIFVFMMASGIGISVDTCIKADNGRYLILLDNSPIAMSQLDNGNKNIFENLKNGDKIIVVQSGIPETFPARTGVYLAVKLSGGHEIPQEIITQLTDLCWMN